MTANDLTSCFFGHQNCWRSFQCKCKLILVLAYNCWNIFPIYAIVCRCGHANCTFTKKQILPASKLVATPAWRITSSVTDMFKGQDIVNYCWLLFGSVLFKPSYVDLGWNDVLVLFFLFTTLMQNTSKCSHESQKQQNCLPEHNHQDDFRILIENHTRTRSSSLHY